MTQTALACPEDDQQEEQYHVKNHRRPKGKARHAAKRALFPLINTHIIAAAETGDLNLLVSTIVGYLPQMNLVNVSTALHRLAKRTVGVDKQQAALRHHPVLSGLLQCAAASLARTETGGAQANCQALCNITWSMATLQYVDIPLLETVAQLACATVSSFKSFELSSTLWAFAKLGSIEPAACECALPFFEVAAEALQDHINDFTFRCLVMAAWGFASAHQHDVRLFRGIASKLMPSIHTANSQELANTAWAFSMANVHQDKLFAEIARKAALTLSEFKAQELSSLMWSFAANGFFHEEFFERAACVVRFLELDAPQIADVMWALSQARPRSPTTHATVLALLPRCTTLLGTFKPKELSSVALAAAECFGRGRTWPSRETGSLERPFTVFLVLPVQVTEFFMMALPHVGFHLSEYSDKSLANVVLSFLAVQISDGTGLFHSFGCEILKRVGSLEISPLLQLLCDLPATKQWGHVVQVLLGEAAHRMDSMRPEEMQMLSQIITGSEAGALTKSDLQDACRSLAEAPSWSSQCPEDIEDALLDHPSPTNREGLDSEEASLQDGCQASPEPVKHTLSAACEAVKEDVEGSSRKSFHNLDVPVPYSVKNTFLHVVEDNEEARHTCQDEDQQISLPPSLDIIPLSVSAAKLNAYRMDYQKFRIGKAVGAKGELSSTVTCS